MEAIRVSNLSFRYPGGGEALKNINLLVNRGDFLTLCGQSGCGKTTLLRLLCPSLSPNGERSGEIYFEGRPLEELTARELCEKIAFVPQDPENRLVTDTVWHELAFGLENLGVPPAEIRLRVAETAEFFGIEELFRRPVNTLSGGQKQLVCLAAAMTLRPSLLILDEPSSQLDPIGAENLFRAVRRINSELGVTVILSEHRTEDTLPLSSRLAVMEKGRIMLQGDPLTVCEGLKRKESYALAFMPTPSRVWAALNGEGPCPFTPAQGRSWLEERLRAPLPPFEKEPPPPSGKWALRTREVWFRYEKNGRDVLRGLDLTVRSGELFALVGGNGAGKSSLLSVLAGLARPYRGRAEADGRAALLPQDPRTLFLRSTLKEDLLSVLPPEERGKGLPEDILDFWQLDELLPRHPYDLSGGELQRSAMAKLMLTRPDILLLDEPTKGLDPMFKRNFAQMLRELCRQGKTVLLVSHDLEFCAMCADRCAILFDGEAMGCGETREFFTGSRFYTTAAARMAGDMVPGAILDADLILACGGAIPEYPPPPSVGGGGGQAPAKQAPAPAPKKSLPLKSVLTSCLFLLLTVLTALLGPAVFGERRYYFTALLMIFWCGAAMVPIFEGRPFGARELVFMSVLSALAVAGRAALYMLPQCKPTLALVILSGAALGGRAAFAVGALTAFVSNFFFGHGPWTPWQMLALGLVGLFAGLLFSRREKKQLLPLCIYGAAASVIIYGGIMNLSSLLSTQAELSWEAAAAVYALGLPMDLVQAASTVVFLLLLTKPLMEKLDRAKLKFGLSAPI